MMGLAETKEAIAAHGKAQVMQASNHDLRGEPIKAARCRLRAEHAEAGFLLDQEEEYREPGYAMNNQDLRAAAHHHKLVIGPDDTWQNPLGETLGR